MVRTYSSFLKKRREYHNSLKLFVIILVLLLIIVIGALYIFNFRFSNDQISTNNNTNIFVNIAVGVASSLFSSILFYIFFNFTVEEIQKEYSAESAAIVATQHALDRLKLVPQYVYPASEISNPEFDEQFKKSFEGSNFYYFKGASAGFASYRLNYSNTIHNSRSLDNKAIRILVLDPRNTELLKEFARSNLRLSTDGKSRLTPASILNEAEKIQKDIYMTILKIYDNRSLCDIDLCFHNEFVFFRSEIFVQGLFISYYDGTKPFPGSMYYDCDSDIYQAYLRNFRYCDKIGCDTFSLKERIKQQQSIEDILKSIGYKSTLNELNKYVDQKFKSYQKKT